jgi:hypothetical protein
MKDAQVERIEAPLVDPRHPLAQGAPRGLSRGYDDEPPATGPALGGEETREIREIPGTEHRRQPLHCVSGPYLRMVGGTRVPHGSAGHHPERDDE